jgi:hypothetical protein
MLKRETSTDMPRGTKPVASRQGMLHMIDVIIVMSRHGSQERMDAGSPSAVPPSASLASSPSGSVLRSHKRRRVSRDGSCSTSTESVVTAILGATDIFEHLRWHVWTTGKIQCLHQGIMPSERLLSLETFAYLE